ncbi:MAG: hypothetical protein ACLRWA_06520 [Lachnospira sp.]
MLLTVQHRKILREKAIERLAMDEKDAADEMRSHWIIFCRWIFFHEGTGYCAEVNQVIMLNDRHNHRLFLSSN